jgi:RNA polymerase primary sigma factor
MPAAYPDSFSDYLKVIGRYPLLTPSQEIELSRQAQRYIELRDTEGKPSTREERRDFRVGKRAFDKMITSNLRLVVNIAKKFVSRSGQTLDSSRGYKFSTYSYWWIRQAICRGIDQNDRMIRIPIHVLEKLHRLMKLREAYQRENPGKELTLQEAAKRMNVKAEELALAMERNGRMNSLDSVAVTKDGDGSALVELIASEQPEDQEIYASDVEQREAIDSAMAYIGEDHAEILIRYYGLDGGPEETLQAIAKTKGVSRERIRQKRDTALRRIGRHLGPALR